MLQETIKPTGELKEQEVETMWQIMCSHYGNMSREKFLADLAEKEGVLLVHSPEGTVRGFSTYMLLHTHYHNEDLTLLYSGDTIVEHAYWGHPASLRAFAVLVKYIVSRFTTKKYWLLLSKGYRTYQLLPLFFKKYYPNYQDLLPGPQRELLTHMAGLKFGGAYYEEQGLLKLAPGADYLREEFCQVPEHKRRSPEVDFFQKANPGYLRGTELICMAQLERDNFKRALERLM